MAGRSRHLDPIILWIYGFPLAVIADEKIALSVCQNLDEAAIAQFLVIKLSSYLSSVATFEPFNSKARKHRRVLVPFGKQDESGCGLGMPSDLNDSH